MKGAAGAAPGTLGLGRNSAIAGRLIGFSNGGLELFEELSIGGVFMIAEVIKDVGVGLFKLFDRLARFDQAPDNVHAMDAFGTFIIRHAGRFEDDEMEISRVLPRLITLWDGNVNGLDAFVPFDIVTEQDTGSSKRYGVYCCCGERTR